MWSDPPINFHLKCMGGPLFKYPIVCKSSNNASLCTPRQYRKQDRLLFPFIRLTGINIRVSWKLQSSRNISQWTLHHKKNSLNIYYLKLTTKTFTYPYVSQEENIQVPLSAHLSLDNIPSLLSFPHVTIFWQQEDSGGSVPLRPSL